MICKIVEIIHEYVVIARVGYEKSHDRLINLDNNMKSVFQVHLPSYQHIT